MAKTKTVSEPCRRPCRRLRRSMTPLPTPSGVTREGSAWGDSQLKPTADVLRHICPSWAEKGENRGLRFHRAPLRARTVMRGLAGQPYASRSVCTICGPCATRRSVDGVLDPRAFCSVGLSVRRTLDVRSTEREPGRMRRRVGEADPVLG